jgi:hypothetical protein
MAYSANILEYGRTYTSAGDMSATQYTFVKRAASDTVVTAGAGEAAVGVQWNAPAAADRPVSVIIGGEPNVYVGTGGVTVGDELAADANGKAVTAASADVVLGIARETAAENGLVRFDFLGEAQYTKA